MVAEAEPMKKKEMVHSPILTYFSVITLLSTFCHPTDGSILHTFNYLKEHGFEGFLNIWPKPTAVAWKIIACYAPFEAEFQLWLPGKRVEGPISPTGNKPVYKANGVLAYAVTPVYCFLHFSVVAFFSYCFCFLMLTNLKSFDSL